MKIRQNLENKLRSYSSGKAGGSRAHGQSFESEIAARRNTINSQPGNFSHHAVRRPQKNITLAQANRLAQYAPTIQECSKKYNVPVELICAVILQESGGNAKAVSPAGARGLMQLMPGTARRFGVTNSFDPRQNIEGGTKYLRFLMDEFKGDYRLVLAGYNSGEGNVKKHGNRIPPFAETQNYVPSVLAYADTIHRILNTPVTASAALPPHARKV